MIVIDASAAVKWTVEEHLHSEALSLAKGDFSLVAPNLVVVETLNVIRRKMKRGEIASAQFDQAAEELANVFDLLVAESTLARRISMLSSALDHSVYDCAYLACALEYDAPLVTADLRFTRKLENSAFRNSVVQLGEGSSAALVSKLGQKSIERRALQLYQIFEQALAQVRDQVTTQLGIFDAAFTNPDDIQTVYETPSYIRLRRFVTELSQPEQARLLALAWFGRSYTNDPWEKVLTDASEYVAMRNSEPASYIIRTFATLAAGLAKLSSDAKSSSPGRT